MPEILFAYLYGSRARGDARPDSDWDVGVYLREDMTARERFKMRLRLDADLEDLGRMDIAVLNDAPPFFCHRVIMGERLVVRDKAVLVRFSVRVFMQSEDQRYYRELHYRAMDRRLEEGTFGRA